MDQLESRSEDDHKEPSTPQALIHRTIESDSQKTTQDYRFWLLLSSLFLASFVAALDFTAVSTALPSIAREFNSSEVSWIGSSYALAGAALVPFAATLADVFGRKAMILTALFLFALGSALCASAQSMEWLIAGRAVQVRY